VSRRARQFDVFANPNASRAAIPYLVVLQSDVLDQTDAILCAPLIPADQFPATFGGLNPSFAVKSVRYVLSPDQMAPLPRRLLKAPVASLAAERDAIARAIDLLFFGI
jgi:toxin CcdB